MKFVFIVRVPALAHSNSLFFHFGIGKSSSIALGVEESVRKVLSFSWILDCNLYAISGSHLPSLLFFCFLS